MKLSFMAIWIVRSGWQGPIERTDTDGCSRRSGRGNILRDARRLHEIATKRGNPPVVLRPSGAATMLIRYSPASSYTAGEMTEGQLSNLRILVANDDYFLVQQICELLRREGAIIVGPAPSNSDAMKLLEAQDRLHDAALVNGKLRDSSAAPLLRFLAVTGVPCVIATDRGPLAVPADHGHCVVVNTPATRGELAAAVRRAIAAYQGRT
ncbi:hypothetical protein [Stakelama saccharophila]|uniref:Response regulatory domain-containing protein n=1 Tax=Stakelama saccharophila TaxID=3075605 RepID=A0ABZ0B624_9SPHN|nr:hypothetical protein [Stakelama sp. W311]WNO52852.1 hypothetical protein RPR59_10325 [Stakelama sp. W311]